MYVVILLRFGNLTLDIWCLGLERRLVIWVKEVFVVVGQLAVRLDVVKGV